MVDSDDGLLTVAGDEFADYRGAWLPFTAEWQVGNLLTPSALRGLAAIGVSIALLQAGDRSPRVFAVLVALLLGAWAVGAGIQLARTRGGSAAEIARTVAALALAIGLAVWPGLTALRLGQTVGFGLIGFGAVTAWRALRTSQPGTRVEPAVGASLYIAIGAALLISPLQLLSIVVLGLCLLWFVAGVLAVVTSVRAGSQPIDVTGTWTAFLEWIETRPQTAHSRRDLYGKIFFEGDEATRRLSRFFALMTFATAIAAFGIVADSTAVVIGAMLVAPLMTPLMGVALALAMGWPRRAAMSVLVALGGVVVAIGLGVIFGWAYPPTISTTLNSQVATRVGPTLIDLVIAIAAGGAGAFALSRPDVSDSLPGVAVAIALVPPLTVTGLMVAQGSWPEAAGSLLLFTTNLVAIILVGGVVFLFTGVVPRRQLSRHSSQMRVSLGMVAILAVAVVAVLSASTEAFRAEVQGVITANEQIDAWLSGTDLERLATVLDRNEISVSVQGPDPPPSVEDLASALDAALGREVDVAVSWTPRTVFE